mmetsp:Transcript_34857/g.86508  ORF Transcript_34857/g.86508 Transcript_34857/m.86508 type:complete len:213 (-) Transcript_34857:387-1025(-)
MRPCSICRLLSRVVRSSMSWLCFRCVSPAVCSSRPMSSQRTLNSVSFLARYFLTASSLPRLSRRKRWVSSRNWLVSTRLSVASPQRTAPHDDDAPDGDPPAGCEGPLPGPHSNMATNFWARYDGAYEEIAVDTLCAGCVCEDAACGGDGLGGTVSGCECWPLRHSSSSSMNLEGKVWKSTSRRWSVFNTWKSDSLTCNVYRKYGSASLVSST